MLLRTATILKFVGVVPMWQAFSFLALVHMGIAWGLSAVVIGVLEFLVNLLLLRVTPRYRYFVLLEATELGLCLCLCLGSFLVVAWSAQLWAVGLVSLGIFALGGVAFDRWICTLAPGNRQSNQVSFLQMQQNLSKAKSQAKQSADPRIALLTTLPPILLGLIYMIVRILDSSVARSLIALLIWSIGTFFFFVAMRRGYCRIVEWEQQTGQTQLVREFLDRKR